MDLMDNMALKLKAVSSSGAPKHHIVDRNREVCKLTF
jgi:hypothetical protein